MGSNRWLWVGQRCGNDPWRGAARRRGKISARRPAAEELEPRRLLSTTSLNLSGRSLTEKLDKSFTAVVANFTATGEKANASSFRATIQWGDGITSKGTVVLVNKARGKFEVKGTHKYKNGVSNQVATITVTDVKNGGVNDASTGGSATTETPVDVEGAAISVDVDDVSGLYGATEGAPYTGLVAFVTVLEGYDSLVSNLQATATIVYPDGTSETVPFTAPDSQLSGYLTADSSGVYRFPESTPPADPASIEVIIKGSFDAGNKSYLFQKTIETPPINVLDAPLEQYTPPGTSPVSGDTGVPLVVTEYFLDASTLANATEYTGTVTWGDGQTTPLTNSNFVIRGQLNGETEVQVTCTHVYNSIGTEPVKITVNDVGGSSVVLTGSATTLSSLLQMWNPYAEDVGQNASQMFPGPDAGGEIGEITLAPGTNISQYTITVNWGDGSLTTSPTLYAEPDSNNLSFRIQDDHTWAQGGSSEVPDYYTITVTITGPGIAAGSPITGTSTQVVYDLSKG